MTAKERKAYLQLIQRLENFVGADGKVDVNEAKSILGLVTPLAEVDADCRALKRLVEAVPADGKVTDEESAALLRLIDRLAVKNTGLVYGIEDKPPFFESLFAALQHLLAIFVGIITPPIIICSALGTSGEVKAFMISMALFASGRSARSCSACRARASSSSGR